MSKEKNIGVGRGMRGWGLQVLLRPTKATVGTLAGMRWEASGGES